MRIIEQLAGLAETAMKELMKQMDTQAELERALEADCKALSEAEQILTKAEGEESEAISGKRKLILGERQESESELSACKGALESLARLTYGSWSQAEEKIRESEAEAAVSILSAAGRKASVIGCVTDRPGVNIILQ